jgi:hypothetical protein
MIYEMVYVKTSKATEEIQTKKYGLKGKVRNLLFLIDGVKPVEAIERMSLALGLTAPELSAIETEGFIARAGRGGKVQAATADPIDAATADTMHAATAYTMHDATADAVQADTDTDADADAEAETEAMVTDEAPSDEAGRFRIAKQYMNDTVVNSLGLRGFFFTLKLEQAGTCQDLEGLLDAYAKTIAKASTPEAAQVMAERARELLA